MDLASITVADFKSLFFRDFPYLPEYNPAALYNAGRRVYYSTTLLFYDCLVNGTTDVTPGTDVAVWSVVADDVDNYILDADITKAFAEAMVLFNQALFTSDANIKLGYLYLTAHFLCYDIRAARGGVDSSGLFPANSRSVGNVSESYSIPTAYIDNPILQPYTASAYGMKYLALVYPMLTGNIGIVAGWTDP